jgi:hypothetical protein
MPPFLWLVDTCAQWSVCVSRIKCAGLMEMMSSLAAVQGEIAIPEEF